MTKHAKSRIYFHFDNTAFSLKNRSELKHFIEQIFRDKKKELATLSYVFSTDRKVLKINREYLNHDFYTDVIAFDLSDTRRHIQGETYISIDRVKQNAIIYKVPFSQELRRVMFHAALHLCGYSDETTYEREIMKKEENGYLAQYLKLFHVKQSY